MFFCLDSSYKSANMNILRFLWIYFNICCGYHRVFCKQEFEAAFQGGCGIDSPCKQSCFDLHDGTHECSCFDGFYLDNDGYSCIEESLRYLSSNDTEDDGVVIESSFADGKSLRSPKSSSHTKDNKIHDKENAYSHRRSNRVLSLDAEDEFHRYAVDGEVVTEQDLSAYLEKQAEFFPFVDPKTYRSCDDLECESGGVCVEMYDSDVIDKDHVVEVRCKCPLGRGGFYCESVITLKYPKFLGWSYMGYPILMDASHSMQVILEFRSESDNGLLLYSGEMDNLVGDMISISLVNQYVEFRFDCGLGIGMLLSDRPVVMNDWNSLTIYREGWKAWMQLNDGMQVQGRSRGLFSSITFRQRLYLGGSPNIRITKNRTAIDKGFTGCVRRLEVNNKIYNFNVPGYVVEGVDVAECSSDVCGGLVCQNGGHCIISSPEDVICLCMLGFTGKYCQQKIHIEVPHFNGFSYLKHPGLATSMLSFTEIEVVFKPNEPNGVLLYNGYKPNSGDFIVINLVDGFVEFRFDLGSGTAILRSVERITMKEWHTVFISRTSRYAILQVDNQAHVEGLSPGAFTQLSLPLSLHLGGVSDLRHVTSNAHLKESFVGCIQKVVINGKQLKLTESAITGVNIDNCDHSCVNVPCQNGGVCEARSKYYTCHCNLGSSGFNCENVHEEDVHVPMFRGQSFLKYDDKELMKRIIGNKMNIELRFKTYFEDGLIMWSGRNRMTRASDYIAIGVKGGFVTFQYNLGSGEVVIVHNSTRVDDGDWHVVRALRTEREGLLIVDSRPFTSGESLGGLVQLNVNDGLYIGGMNEVGLKTNSKFKSGLIGCISNVTLATDYRLQLVPKAVAGLNIQPCS